MKRHLIIMALALAACSAASGQTEGQKKSPPLQAEQEVLKVFNEYADAIFRQDAAEFERLLVDDYTFTTPDGQFYTKAQKIALVKSGDVKIESGQRDDVKVRVYGGAAVVTSQYTLKGTYQGEPFAETGRSTATFVKRAGRWQFVADHTSRITQQ